MAKTVRFNKTLLTGLVRDQQSCIVKDREVAGLKFTVGKKRSCFVFEKRISGSKGSPIKITIGAFPAISIELARQQARAYASLCERGIDPREQKTPGQDEQEHCDIRLKTLVAKFFELKSDLSHRTLRKYHYTVNYHFPPEWMDLEVTAITPEALVEQFHEARKTARDGCFTFLKVFSNIWNTCAPYCKGPNDEWLLHTNPVSNARNMLKHIKHDPPRRQFVPSSYLGKFVVTVENWAENKIIGTPTTALSQRYCHLVLLCLFTGMRGIEARSLRWKYIDLEQGLICLPGTADDVAAQFTGVKNKQNHLIPLSTYPWELLRQLHRQRESISPYVFPSILSVNKPISDHGRCSKQLSFLVGIDFGLHACRRTFASVADDVGLDYLKVKRSLNHSFEGGVTGGYINPGFNPDRRRTHFQKICDYILRCKSEYLGHIKASHQEIDEQKVLQELECYALELGLSRARVQELLFSGLQQVQRGA